MNFAELFEAVSAQMTAEFAAARVAVTHAGLKGSINEDTVVQFFRNRLPLEIGICTGLIVDSSGQSSKQIDIIFYDANITPSLFVRGNIYVIPCECVYMAMEVKSFLDSSELEKCIENMRSVKSLRKSAFHNTGAIQLETTLYGKKFKHWPTNYFIFAFDSISLDTIAIRQKEMLLQLPIESNIDMIFSLSKGLLANCSDDGIGATPEPSGRLCVIDNNHLMVFYVLISHLATQINRPKLKITDYFNSLRIERRLL